MNESRPSLISREQYSFTHRQINKVKGFEVNFRAANESWPISIGFAKTLKEAKEIMQKHKSKITG